MNEAVKRIPLDYCPEVQRDRQILDTLSKDAISVIHVGTVTSGTDYKDIYIVITRDRIPHIICVRRMCVSEKILKKTEGFIPE